MWEMPVNEGWDDVAVIVVFTPPVCVEVVVIALVPAGVNEW